MDEWWLRAVASVASEESWSPSSYRPHGRPGDPNTCSESKSNAVSWFTRRGKTAAAKKRRSAMQRNEFAIGLPGRSDFMNETTGLMKM